MMEEKTTIEFIKENCNTIEDLKKLIGSFKNG